MFRSMLVKCSTVVAAAAFGFGFAPGVATAQTPPPPAQCANITVGPTSPWQASNGYLTGSTTQMYYLNSTSTKRTRFCLESAHRPDLRIYLERTVIGANDWGVVGQSVTLGVSKWFEADTPYFAANGKRWTYRIVMRVGSGTVLDFYRLAWRPI